MTFPSHVFVKVRPSKQLVIVRPTTFLALMSRESMLPLKECSANFLGVFILSPTWATESRISIKLGNWAQKRLFGPLRRARSTSAEIAGQSANVLYKPSNVAQK